MKSYADFVAEFPVPMERARLLDRLTEQAVLLIQAAAVARPEIWTTDDGWPASDTLTGTLDRIERLTARLREMRRPAEARAAEIEQQLAAHKAA